jgi:TM2 domain-containing membrane protein YozV
MNVYPGGLAISPNNQKSKIAVLLFGIFLGIFGAHNFYLGYNGKAIAQLLITVLSLGFLAFISAIWALIESIMIFTSPMPVDGRGVPLRD